AYNFIRDVPDSVLAQNPSLNRPFEDQFGKDNRYKTYGLNLSIPILNGLQSRTRLVQNKGAYENARINTRNVEVTLKADVLRTSRNFDLAKRSYTVSQTQAEAAEVAFQFESERYNLGVTNFVDFAQANRAMVQAQTDRAQAEYRLLFQKILLEYAMGTLKVEGLQQ
ncbi:MAG: TolC family protein, partial [Cyclobacteriaceae bacterium]